MWGSFGDRAFKKGCLFVGTYMVQNRMLSAPREDDESTMHAIIQLQRSMIILDHILITVSLSWQGK